MTNKQEQGRSMVEMLGVLAVVGVLSAGGIAGYTYAMDRHRTNELLNEASKRAVVVASQIASGRTPSLAEFGTGETAGGTFATDAVTDIDDAVGIKVTGVKDSVCENLVKLENDRVYMAKDDASLTALTEADCTGDNATFLIVFEGMGGGTGEGTTITCEESEKVSVTYTGGRCCNETKTGKFCPGDEPPTCVRDAGCDCSDESCCTSIGANWTSNSIGEGICCETGTALCSAFGDCICVPAGYNSTCGPGACISCPSTQIPSCEGTDCLCVTDPKNCNSKECCDSFGGSWNNEREFCVPSGYTMECNGYNCITCSPSEGTAKCPTESGSCICAQSGYSVKCNSYNCKVCETGMALCSAMGECICVPNGYNSTCSLGYCIACPSTQTPSCDGADCTCY